VLGRVRVSVRVSVRDTVTECMGTGGWDLMSRS